MTEPTHCPYCGCPGQSPLDLLYREVTRIREIAERGGTAEGTRPVPPAAPPVPPAAEAAEPAGEDARSAARIAELTREVHELRATVARLRGCAAPTLARSA